MVKIRLSGGCRLHLSLATLGNRIMPNPRLSADRLAIANALLDDIRHRLRDLTARDEGCHWALRRKVAKESMHDQRGKPMHRRRPKAQKRDEQGGLCPVCKMPLPAT
ncbi:hypothetical protein [uncultured Sphingomonas sp.]|uniref:hypothetical protein n=1 Tax=uncultured Sphingomonas sp. TaxID=158754 RepID=UPI0025D634BE|nr:hypothetical protein [uncultured Sphingomonas sp.]